MRVIPRHQKDHLLSIREQLVDSCEICGGAGYVINEGLDVPCECMKLFRYVKELVIAAIPETYWELSLEKLVVNQAYKDFISFYLDNLKRAHAGGLGVLFLGTNGVGKTAMMCEIGKSAVAQGYSVKYFTIQQYVDLTIKFGTESNSFVQLHDMLLVDELDKAYMKEGSSFVPKIVEHLFRSTIPYGKMVIAATNESEEGLKDLFGESTLSMVHRNLKFVPVSGIDYSENLQKGWKKRLLHTVDFKNEHLIELARQYRQGSSRANY